MRIKSGQKSSKIDMFVGSKSEELWTKLKVVNK